VARRISTFDEVVGGLDESNALFEARRYVRSLLNAPALGFPILQLVIEVLENILEGEFDVRKATGGG